MKRKYRIIYHIYMRILSSSTCDQRYSYNLIIMFFTLASEIITEQKKALFTRALEGTEGVGANLFTGAVACRTLVDICDERTVSNKVIFGLGSVHN